MNDNDLDNLIVMLLRNEVEKAKTFFQSKMN